MRKVKIGVLGCGRGSTMIDYCLKNNDAELVAVCDNNPFYLNGIREKIKKKKVGTRCYDNFEDFLKEDMDGVVLANFANDHAPFAIRCLDRGFHVMSEVLPCETLKEAVELCDAVERSGKIYSYAENYCFFRCTREIKRLYRKGFLGEFEYGEGEYIHNCEDSWGKLTNADPNHWRNTKSAFFYCTHSAGPLIHATGLRPVRVQGIEGKYSDKMKNLGAGGASIAVEMVTLENGGLFKSIHGGGLSNSSIRYTVYGTEAVAESASEYSLDHAPTGRIFLNKKRGKFVLRSYRPEMDKRAVGQGHDGSDWYTMHNFIAAINGQPAEIIDVYEALDMFFVGHFGYFSALNQGIVTDIPDFRDKSVREQYRNDTRCCTKEKAGDALLPSNTQGGQNCPKEAYVALQKQLNEYKEMKQNPTKERKKHYAERLAYLMEFLRRHRKIK